MIRIPFLRSLLVSSIILAAVVPTACHKNENLLTEDQTGQVIMPLAVGNRWWYADTMYSLTGSFVFTWSRVITGVSTIQYQGGAIEVFHERWDSPAPGGEEWLLRNETDGLYCYGCKTSKGVFVLGRSLEAKYPVSPGHAWQANVIYIQSDSTAAIDHTTIRTCTSVNEKYVTPAGTFACIVYETQSQQGTTVTTSREYYAPGVGPVGFTASDNQGVSFKEVLLPGGRDTVYVPPPPPVTLPSLLVTPWDRPVSNAAGTTTFSVANTGGGTMNWTASSNVTWAMIISGASGTNAGVVTVSYTQNTSTASGRTAQITVSAPGVAGSPQTVTVSQTAAPPQLDVTGLWQGTFSTSLVQSASITFALIQTGAGIAGTYTTGGGAGGTISGSLIGNTLPFTLTQTTAACPGSFSGTATLTNSTTMSFTLSGHDCLGNHTNGQGLVTKQ